MAECYVGSIIIYRLRKREHRAILLPEAYIGESENKSVPGRRKLSTYPFRLILFCNYIPPSPYSGLLHPLARVSLLIQHSSRQPVLGQSWEIKCINAILWLDFFFGSLLKLVGKTYLKYTTTRLYNLKTDFQLISYNTSTYKKITQV